MDTSNGFTSVGTLKITAGITDLAARSMVENRDQQPVPAVLTDLRPGSRQWLKTNEKELEISVLTAEGDKVTLSSSFTSRQKSYLRPVGTYIPGMEDSLIQTENLDVTVKGDLSESELKDIEAFKDAIKDVLDKFFGNGTDTSSKVSDIDLAGWESLSSAKADFRETSSMAWAAEMTYLDSEDLPGVGERMVTLEDLPRVGAPLSAQRMQSVVEVTGQTSSASVSAVKVLGNPGAENTLEYQVSRQTESSMSIDLYSRIRAYGPVNGTNSSVVPAELKEPVTRIAGLATHAAATSGRSPASITESIRASFLEFSTETCTGTVHFSKTLPSLYLLERSVLSILEKSTDGNEDQTHPFEKDENSGEGVNLFA
ncbi:MAG: hypothetical protein JEZ12_03335 [Desulfobacterium sp.]|nr:hypothetical protein [Desulfobacterium sp.]